MTKPVMGCSKPVPGYKVYNVTAFVPDNCSDRYYDYCFDLQTAGPSTPFDYIEFNSTCQSRCKPLQNCAFQQNSYQCG